MRGRQPHAGLSGAIIIASIYRIDTHVCMVRLLLLRCMRLSYLLDQGPESVLVMEGSRLVS